MSVKKKGKIINIFNKPSTEGIIEENKAKPQVVIITQQLRNSLNRHGDLVKSASLGLVGRAPSYLFKKEQILKRQQILHSNKKPKKYLNVSSRYKTPTLTLPPPPAPSNKTSISFLSDDKLGIIDTDASSISESSENINSSNNMQTTTSSTTTNTSASTAVIEKFFNKQVGLDVSSSSLSSSSSSARNNQSTLLSNEERESFVESFFNSSPLSSSSVSKKKSKLFSHQASSETEETVVNFKEETEPLLPPGSSSSSIQTKIKHLEGLRFQDEQSNEVISDYLNAFQTLNDSRVMSFAKKSSPDCKCVCNGLRCCIQVKNENKNKCCNACFNWNQSNDSHLDLRNSPPTELVQASRLLISNQELSSFLLTRPPNDCFCMSGQNLFKCCIETMHAQTQKLGYNQMPDILPDRFFTNKCCLNCKPTTSAATKTTQSTTTSQYQEENPSKIKDKFWAQFFYHSDPYNEAMSDEARAKLLVSKSVERLISLVPEMATKKPRAPRHGVAYVSSVTANYSSDALEIKSNIKKKSTSTQVLNPNRKCVTFIEDPKFGFMPVTVPDWQENLREPAYSNKMSKFLSEWQTS